MYILVIYFSGFSETEVKYKHTEVKVLKDGKKKEKKKKQHVKIQKNPGLFFPHLPFTLFVDLLLLLHVP